MSLKRFSGWEPRTVYEYDDEGRMVSSTSEPEWDDTERAWMLALEQYRREVLCPCGCGFPAEVAQDPMTEFRRQVGPPIRCHIRTGLAQAQKQYRESNPHGEMSGLLWDVKVRQD